MQLQSLSLTNYKQFKALELKCARRLNVLVGVNGAGKSSVLEAISLFLSWYVARLRAASLSATGKPLQLASIRHKSVSAKIEGVCHFYNPQADVAWKIARTKNAVMKAEQSSFEQLNNFLKSFKLTGQLSKENAGDIVYEAVPTLVYYATNRSVLDIPLKIRTHHLFSQLESYDASLEGRADFRSFFEWFRAREDIENERFRDGTATEDLQLCMVKKAMSAFLPGFTHWRIHRQPLRMEVLTPGSQMPVSVNELSDGEKCLLAMVGDLARRLSMANPNSKDSLLGSGIVLIDEVELHLHPQWQKDILPRLLSTFPNLQFFISTHSPLVLSQLNSALYCEAEKRKAGAPESEVVARETAVFTLRNGQLESLLDPETGLIATSEMDEVAISIDQAFDELLEKNEQ
ncbi:MAG: AAA family ATPase [Kiritimatiellia bacterium]